MKHWIDGYNMVILGKTQTSKTSTARELHKESPRHVSIWVNRRGDSRVPNIAGETVESVDGVRGAFERDKDKINLLSGDVQNDIVELRKFLWSVAERTNRNLKMQVIVDEVHDVAPQSGKEFGNFPSRDAVRRFTAEGVKRNIKFVAITQDPVRYDKVSLRQSEYRLVFPMSAEHRDAVKKYNFNWVQVDSGDRYSGTMHTDSGEVIQESVKAKKRYAT